MDENELKDLQKTIAGAIKDGIRDGMAATARAQNDSKSGKTTSSYSASSSGVSSSASEKLTGGPLKAALGQTAQAIQNAGGTVRDFAQNATSATPFIAMFSDELKSVVGYFEETNDTFKGLSKVPPL